MKEFGDRRFDELKLESPTLQDNPDAVLALVRNFIRKGSPGVAHEKFEQRECAHAAARKIIGSALSGHPFRHLLFSLLHRATHLTLRYREYGRLVRSRRCGIERAILVEIGKRLSSEGALARYDDVFHLTVDEVLSYVYGSSATRSLSELVAHRSAEYAEHQNRPQPIRIIAIDSPYLNLPVTPKHDRFGGQRGTSELLRGTGCSPGKIQGRARVIFNPHNCSIDSGDILVTRATDPAWAFLMAAASGLVVERGNLLSHAAIIGRELGIPCVIGVENATSLISEGQIITIDGTNGVVALGVGETKDSHTDQAKSVKVSEEAEFYCREN